MKVKTGETATASISVDLKYRCSSCGKENVVAASLSGSAYTATVMGVNLTRNLQEKATEALSAKLKRILNENDPHRFREANFVCSCKYCKHQEPWAKMDSKRFNNIATVFTGILMCSAFILLIVGVRPFSSMSFLSLLLTILSCVGLTATKIYEAKNCDRMEKLIAKLPPESLPSLLPHETALTRSLQEDTAPHASEPIGYGVWECKHCGTTNKLQFAQCKKCGQYKGS